MPLAASTQPDSVEWGAEFTHGIGHWPANRLIAQSAGRGWRSVHAALATVNSWSGMLAPTGHPCLAYCLHRPARLRRRIRGVGGVETGTVRPRQFLVIPGQEATEWHRHGSSDMLMLYLRQDMIESVASGNLGATGQATHFDLTLGTADPLLEQIALSILRLLQQPEDGSSALYVESLTQTLVLHLLRRETGIAGVSDQAAKQDLTALRRIPDLIEAELSSELTIATLAREAQLSPQTFARAFGRRFGTTVHQYIIARRLERAKHLLISTDLPVVQVALQTGFASQSHLATAFKRLTGLTPAEFRSD